MIPYADTAPSLRLPPWTALLIAINVVVFIFELMSIPEIDQFIRRYALVPAAVSLDSPATWYRFVSAMFLHGGFLHIIINMLFLWVFGNNVEYRLGWLYVPFYFLGGIAGNVIQYALTPDSIIPILGASGAVAAVLGAYLVLFPRHKIKAFVPLFIIFFVVQVPAWLMLVYWFFVQFFSGYASLAQTAGETGGPAYFAHIGGFAVGLVTGLAAGLLRPRSSRSVRNLSQ